MRFLLFTLLLSATATVHADPVARLAEVGDARLKVMFWTIYDSALYSTDGDYRGVEADLALRIDYRRNISSSQLIEQTRKEWRKQSLHGPQSERWLAELAGLWPDVRRGDTLVLKVNDDLSSSFFLNQESLGSIEDPQFTRQFLAIWLSENSSYPGLRRQLVGLD